MIENIFYTSLVFLIVGFVLPHEGVPEWFVAIEGLFILLGMVGALISSIVWIWAT